MWQRPLALIIPVALLAVAALSAQSAPLAQDPTPEPAPHSRPRTPSLPRSAPRPDAVAVPAAPPAEASAPSRVRVGVHTRTPAPSQDERSDTLDRLREEQQRLKAENRALTERLRQLEARLQELSGERVREASPRAGHADAFPRAEGDAQTRSVETIGRSAAPRRQAQAEAERVMAEERMRETEGRMREAEERVRAAELRSREAIERRDEAEARRIEGQLLTDNHPMKMRLERALRAEGQRAPVDSANTDEANPFGHILRAREEAVIAERHAFDRLSAHESDHGDRLQRVEGELKSLRKEVHDLATKIDRLLEMRGERRIY